MNTAGKETQGNWQYEVSFEAHNSEWPHNLQNVFKLD
jgi:hypothetical protein